MDQLIHSDPTELGRRRWRLLVPPGASVDIPLAAIRVEEAGAGTGGGHWWEQRALARAASGTRLLNLGNSGPLWHRDRLVVIHDAAVFRTPANFGRRYAMGHRVLSRMLARNGRIATVSEFSRSELAQLLGIRAEAIVVAHNGSDHFEGRMRDDGVLAELGVAPGRYFLFVGNPAPNKNLAVLMQAFARLERPGAKLVVAGSLDRSVFGGQGAAMPSEAVIVAPGRSDAQIAALYAHAAAHVFPSLYEGFGIPPLEAMASGCPVIASDIAVLHEVCGAAARYFPPRDAQTLADLMRRHWDDPAWAAALRPAAAERLMRFRWEGSARRLIDAALAP